MPKSFLLTALGLVSALAGSASAANYSNEVLSIGVGARALGMGGAYVAVADDSTATYWNPAGLPKIKHVEISAVQQGREYSGSGLNEVGSEYFFMSGGMTVPDLGSFGVAIMRFAVDDIPQVSGVDASGAPIEVGTFKTQDLALMAAYGLKLNKALNAGVTLKYLTGGTSGLVASGPVAGDATSTYYGADLGMMLDFGTLAPSLDGLVFGLNAQDVVGSGVSWQNTPTDPVDSVDANPKMGLAYSPPFAFLKDNGSILTLAFDADPKYGSNTLLHYGTEFWYKDTLAFRGGLRQFLGGLQGVEYSLGASFRLYIIQADYAFINYELTPMHYLSLSVHF
jgi:hypothetical protein